MAKITSETTKTETVERRTSAVHQFAPAAETLGATGDYLMRLHAEDATYNDDKLTGTKEAFSWGLTLSSPEAATSWDDVTALIKAKGLDTTAPGSYIQALSILYDKWRDDEELRRSQVSSDPLV